MPICATCGLSIKSSSTLGEKSGNPEIDRATAMKIMSEGKDPWCDPHNPLTVSLDDIKDAYKRLDGKVVKTTMKKSHFSENCGIDIMLKPEMFQRTGSFKDRPAYNYMMLLKEEDKKKGVVTAPSGNFARALAYVGKVLNVPVTVVLPIHVSTMTLYACRAYGAEVILHGEHAEEAVTHALKVAVDKDRIFARSSDHYDIIAGSGTLGLEILEQVPDLDCVVIPTGGGGLLAGCAKVFKSLKPSVKVYGINSNKCPSFYVATQLGRSEEVVSKTLVADEVYIPKVGVNAFETARGNVDKIQLISDCFVAASIVRLVETEKIVTEHAGALGFAAILSGQLPRLERKKVVVILTGGNEDSNTLCKVIDKGLAAEGRYLKVKCWLPSVIGAVEDFVRECASAGAEIKHIIRGNNWVEADVYQIGLKVVMFVKDNQHAMEIKRKLDANYDDVIFDEYPMNQHFFDLF